MALLGRPMRIGIVGLAALLSVLALGSARDARAIGSSPGPLLVIAAHPDDETLMGAGVIESAVAAGRQVYVAVVTNGAGLGGYAAAACGRAEGSTESGSARKALERNGETRAAMGVLGVPTSHIFFLGYPDLSMPTMVAGGAPTDHSGINATYADDFDGNDATCNGDYHYTWTTPNAHAPLTIASLQADLDHLLATVQPTDLVTHLVADGHVDHAEVAREVLQAVERNEASHVLTAPVTVHSGLVHPQGNFSCQYNSAYRWPNPAGTPDPSKSAPASRATPGADFEAPPVTEGDNPACPSSVTAVATGYDWGSLGAPDEVVPVPADMQTALPGNKKWQAIASYPSQISCTQASDGTYPASCGYMYAFVKKSEPFWTRTIGASPAPTPMIADSGGAPGLSGTGVNVGNTLAVTRATSGGVNARNAANGTWLETGLAFAYQWLRCDATSRTTCSDIAGETGTSYTIATADMGFTLRARITATDSGGSTSIYTGSIPAIPAPPANTVLPVLTGTAADGSVLSTSNGTWTGTAPITYTYAWSRATSTSGPWTTISAATGSAYTVTGADIGSYLRVTVTATNSAGNDSATALPSAKVVASPPTSSVAPALGGSTVLGHTLTATAGTWTGTAPITYTYAWSRSASTSGPWDPISGSTASHTITTADVGSYLRVTVTATNSVGSASASSPASALVTAEAPANTVLPVLSGTASDGSALTTTDGTWSGTIPMTFTYVWARATDTGGPWTTIAGATGSSYTATEDDVGAYLRVTVTATNSVGNASATSAPSTKVAAVAPANSVLPAVAGTAAAGSVVSTTGGTWTGTTPVTFTYAWSRATDIGGPWTAIAGATGSSYTATTDDVGGYLRVTVTATNSAGSASATSLSSAKVTTAPPAGGGGTGTGTGSGSGSGNSSSGGGGGGGGGGGLVGDLRLQGTAEPSDPPVGSAITWRLTLTDANGGDATGVWIDVRIPDSVALTFTYADRGSGCTVVSPGRLHCDLAWINATVPAHVVIQGTVLAVGDHVLSAIAGFDFVDPAPADNELRLALTTTPPQAITAPPVVTAPQISILKATVKKTGVVTLGVSIKGWKINTQPTTHPAKGSGYWVVWVDGKRNAVCRMATMGETKKLAAGRHTVRVELVRENGGRLTPRVLSKTLTLNVPKHR